MFADLTFQLVYSIVAGNGDNHFTMETIKDDGKDIGAVVVEQPLDREQQALYKLTVRRNQYACGSGGIDQQFLSNVWETLHESNMGSIVFGKLNLHPHTPPLCPKMLLH